MDRDKVKKAINDYTNKLRVLDNNYDKETIKFDVDMEDLDRRYEERYNRLLDKKQ